MSICRMSPVVNVDAEDIASTSADYYTDAFAHWATHEELIKDHVRTETFLRAISENGHLFRDKVVLDIGTGPGLFAMAAVKAGAKHVYATEKTGIYRQAERILAKNNMSNKITLFHGAIENYHLPVEKVDIIICDWVGYFLLYESMIESVIYARDKWLVSDGMIFPDKATMFLTAIEDDDYRSEKLQFWDDVYGFKMHTIKRQVLDEPLIDTCEAKQVCSNTCPVLNIDIYSITAEKLNFMSNYDLTFNRDDWSHALVAYFNVQFSKTHTKLSFSTSPKCPWTHWKSVVFYMPQPYKVKSGHHLTGQISVQKHAPHTKELDITITFSCESNRKLLRKSYKLK